MLKSSFKNPNSKMSKQKNVSLFDGDEVKDSQDDTKPNGLTLLDPTVAKSFEDEQDFNGLKSLLKRNHVKNSFITQTNTEAKAWNPCRYYSSRGSRCEQCKALKEIREKFLENDEGVQMSRCWNESHEQHLHDADDSCAVSSAYQDM